MTPEAGPGAVAAEIADRLADVLGDQMRAVVGHGSWVHGDFCPGRSDLDLLVVLRDEPDPELLGPVGAVLGEVTRAHPAWRDRLELGLVTADTVRAVLEGHEGTRQTVRISPGEPLHLVPAARHQLLDWDAAGRGIGVRGPAPGELLPVIPDDVVRSVVVEHLRAWPSWVTGSDAVGFSAYAVLTVSRAAAFLDTGQRTSKRVGATVAAARNREWRELIRWAVRWWYGGGADSDRPPGDVQAFVAALAGRAPASAGARRPSSQGRFDLDPPDPPTPAETFMFLVESLDDRVRAWALPGTLWEGPVPGYTARQAVGRLASLRAHATGLSPLDPESVVSAAAAAGAAVGALRSVLVLSGRRTYEAIRDVYVAYDMGRRLEFLAESAGEPWTWPGVTSRALWCGEVADWSGFDVGPSRPSGLASLAALIKDLPDVRPRPGTEPTRAALSLVEPVLVAAAQRALRWAVVAAVALLQPNADPRWVDAALPAPAERAVPSPRAAVERLRAVDPALGRAVDQLTAAEQGLVDAVLPSKRAGGHMDVRPDEAEVEALLAQAASAVTAVLTRGRRHLDGASGPLTPLAGSAFDLLEMVEPGSWPDDGTRALRQLAELALVLTASSSTTPR